jgi:hypothetical protein
MTSSVRDWHKLAKLNDGSVRITLIELIRLPIRLGLQSLPASRIAHVTPASAQ